MTFTIRFKHDSDKVFLAHSFPYTYSNLCEYLNGIMQDNERNKAIARKKLTKTISGNWCEYLTITSNNMKKRNVRRGIVIFAR